MKHGVGFIKSVLWAVVVSASAALMLFVGLGALGAGTAGDGDGLPAGEETAPAPAISIRQAAGRLLASAEAEAAEWRYAGPNAVAACDSAFFATTGNVRTGRQVVLGEADYGRHYCFRATIDDDYVYHAYLVVDDRPRLAVEQDLNSAGEYVLRAVARQPAGGWQSVGPMATESCLAASFEIADLPPADGRELAVERGSPAGYYCFRARGPSGEWGFAGRRLSFERLELEFRNADGRLEAGSRNWPEGRSGEYVFKAADGCSMEDFADRDRVRPGNSATASAAGNYCFRVKDYGDTYHYGSYRLPS